MKKKILIGIGLGLLVGGIIYFGFIRDASDASDQIGDAGSTGGVGSAPAGAKPRPYIPPSGETKEQEVVRTKTATQGRG